MDADEAAALAALGWSPFFADQLTGDDAGLVPLRIATVHRSRMTAISLHGTVNPSLPGARKTTDFAVGDWVLVQPASLQVVRRLDRHAVLQRKTEGGRAPQLIAANVDTLFVVTSCNDDFNTARLERYLALANEAGTRPVIVLTKADKARDGAREGAQEGARDVAQYRQDAAALQRDLDVVTLNAKNPAAAEVLAPWCGPGQTVALVGSSGVGKSTLTNTLADLSSDAALATGSIREDDAKGRHTTTSRSLHAIKGGGWVIDTPGIRTLHVSEISEGLDKLFAEIVELAPACRFRDCTHAHEPGCAVQAAVAAGTLDPARVERWRKLVDENAANTAVDTGPKGNKTPRWGGKRR